MEWQDLELSAKWRDLFFFATGRFNITLAASSSTVALCLKCLNFKLNQKVSF